MKKVKFFIYFALCLFITGSGLLFSIDIDNYWQFSELPKSYSELTQDRPHISPSDIELTPLYTHNYDVLHYTIDLFINDNDETIEGTTTIKVESTQNGLDEITFNLMNEMNVTEVRLQSTSLSYTHQSNELNIDLGTIYNNGEQFEVEVDYNGHPNDGLHFYGNGLIMSFNCMNEARHWFPCYDYLDDKSDEGVEILITVTNPLVVASNGLLEEIINNPDGTSTYYWNHEYPIPTYLICVHIYEYSHFSDTYDGMPIDYYVYPEDYDDAQIAFENLPYMLECYEDIYLEYKFKDEKYGHAACEFSGGMEHTTMTSIGASLIPPNHYYDWLYAHELSHQWWGDWVTCGTWMDIWLNEGFATYSDALWHEWFYDEDEFKSRMQYFMNRVFNTNEDFPIYDPDYMWGVTVYEKGACILHMMRHIMETNGIDYFDAVRYYGNNHAFDTAITSQFQQDIEDFTGQDWDWFFDEWVYKAGYPEYDWWWEYNGSQQDIHLYVEQTQDIDDMHPIYDMPVDIKADTDSGEETQIIRVDELEEDFYITFSDDVQEVYFDPDNWVLCKETNITDINLVSFNATSTEDGINLRWDIETDEEISGFNLYRRLSPDNTFEKDIGGTPFSDHNSSKDWTKVNSSPITGKNPYTYLDIDVSENNRYFYKLEAITSVNNKQLGSLEIEHILIPTSARITMIYPNPADSQLCLNYEIPENSDITFVIYDISGRKLRNIELKKQSEGSHDISIDIHNVPSGIYIVSLKTQHSQDNEKFVISR
jgi:hypothetical protein